LYEGAEQHKISMIVFQEFVQLLWSSQAIGFIFILHVLSLLVGIRV